MKPWDCVRKCKRMNVGRRKLERKNWSKGESNYPSCRAQQNRWAQNRKKMKNGRRKRLPSYRNDSKRWKSILPSRRPSWLQRRRKRRRRQRRKRKSRMPKWNRKKNKRKKSSNSLTRIRLANSKTDSKPRRKQPTKREVLKRRRSSCSRKNGKN